MDQWDLLQARYGPLSVGADPRPRQAPQPQQASKNTRKGVNRYLPAIGGAAAGILAAPFTGGLSLAGTLAAIGGATAVGSAAGEFGAQKRNREKTDVGNVFEEAAIGGAFGAVPIGGVAKVAKTGIAGRAAPAVPKGVPGMLTKAGQRLESRAGGIGAGEKIGATEQTVNQSTNLLKWGKSKGMPSGDPNAVNLWADNYKNTIGKQIENEVKRINAPFKGSTAAADFRKAFNSNTALRSNPAAEKVALQVEAALKRDVKSNAKLVTTRRNFQDNLNYTRGSGKTPQTEQVYQVAVDTLNNNISKIGPKIKSLNGEYNQASKVLQGSTKQTQRMTRQGENAGAGIVGRIMTGDMAQSAKSKVGSLMQQAAGGSPPPVASGAISRKPSIALGSGALTEALKQVGGREVLGTSPQAPIEDLGAEADPLAQQGEDPLADPNQLPQEEGPASLEEALQQAQQLLGPDATPASYLSYAKAIMAADKPPKTSAALEKQQLQVGGVQDVYDQISQAFSEAGGGRGRIPGIVGKYAGSAGLDSDAYNYNQFRDSLVAPLARAISGEVGVLTDADIKRADGLLPKITDSQKEANNRLRKLQGAISQKKQRVSGPANPGSSGDLAEQILQLQEQGAY